VELCEQKLPAYFINSEEKIISAQSIRHYNLHTKQELLTENYLPQQKEVNILITSGASCPDALVEEVINKLVSFFPVEVSSRELLEEFL
jgi:4-hydroxy-3-methylbut-2-en-1-yl diphosphate reductase